MGLWGDFVGWITGRAQTPVIEDRPDRSTVRQPRAVTYGTNAAYAVEASMAAYAGFALMYAAGKALADDIGKLPLRVLDYSGKAVTDRGDPLLRLLRRPTPSGSGLLMRQQLVLDLRLTGFAVVRVTGAAAGMAKAQFVRCHPRHCKIVLRQDRQPSHVVWRPGGNGAPIRMRVNRDCILFRLPSWRSDEREAYGTGAVEPLHQTLTTDRAAAARAAQAAKRGRPAAFASPKGTDGVVQSEWSDDDSADIQKALQKGFDDGHDGVVLLPRQVQLDLPGWSVKDLAILDIRRMSALEIMAAMGVPPARLGYPVADQAPARDQLRVYWLGLMSDAAVFDEGITNWIDDQRGYIGFQVQHDFRHVRELQFPRDSAINRANVLVSMGVPPRVALDMEGIHVPEDVVLPTSRPAPGAARADNRPPTREPTTDTTPAKAPPKPGAST